MGVIVRLVGIEFRGEREGEVDLDIFTTPWEHCTARISLRKEGTLGLATTKLSLFVSYLHTIVDHYDTRYRRIPCVLSILQGIGGHYQAVIASITFTVG
jgi:hypothetical protein